MKNPNPHTRFPLHGLWSVLSPRGACESRSGAPIFLSDVSFRFTAGGEDLLSGVTMSIAAGEMAAIVGAAGCGKSTLVKMVQGLHSPARGLIRVGGRKPGDGSHWPLTRVGVVPRDGMLFGGSVMSNLLMANPRATKEAVIDACRKAGIHDVVMRLPRHYYADIGERGTRLDAHERRLLALARALLKNPEVLVLDDCLGCDGSFESLAMIDTVNRLKGSMTVLVAARRMPPRLDADIVFRVGGGRLVRLDVIAGRRPVAEGASQAGPQTGSNADSQVGSVEPVQRGTMRTEASWTAAGSCVMREREEGPDSIEQGDG